jgi:hypothetical protein
MIEIQGEGIGYATLVPVDNVEGFTWEDGLKLDCIGGRPVFPRSNMPHRYILMDAGGSRRKGWILPSASYEERVVLADCEPYTILKEISHRVAKPIHANVKVDFWYLKSCLSVIGANAEAIRDGNWEARIVDTIVDVPPPATEKPALDRR